MLEMVSRNRVKALIGSKSALSGPVFAGLVVLLLLFSFNYIRIIPGQSLLTTVIATAGVTFLSVAVLLVTRAIGDHDGWVRPHPAIVVSGLVVAGVVRSVATVLLRSTSGSTVTGRRTCRCAHASARTISAGPRS